jgi:hypothetical protein
MTDGVFTSAANVASSISDPSVINNSANINVTVNDNPAVPILKITRTASNVVLSWSTNAQSFVLQSAASLATEALWTDVTNNPVRVGNQWYVTNSVSGTVRFYRLHQSLISLSATKVSPNAIVISWPAIAGGGTLKSATNLSGSTVWIVVSNPPVVVGNRYYVTNPVSTVNRFYRLFN